jgi:hypothetical protein
MRTASFRCGSWETMGNQGKHHWNMMEIDGICVNMCWILLILYDIMRNARFYILTFDDSQTYPPQTSLYSNVNS